MCRGADLHAAVYQACRGCCLWESMCRDEATRILCAAIYHTQEGHHLWKLMYQDKARMNWIMTQQFPWTTWLVLRMKKMKLIASSTQERLGWKHERISITGKSCESRSSQICNPHRKIIYSPPK